ncbi:hypothetical protein FRB94_007916 [Tulasnella sp. JGI-2019a]|nr:hypothetical protein FRB94_007916 [Tulasnella sp. JGI-2019a]
MDSSILPIHHHLQAPLQPSPHDPTRYIYDHQSQFNPIHHQSASSWSPPSQEAVPYQSPPIGNSSLDVSDLLPSQAPISPSKSNAPPMPQPEGRVTRKKAAAMARGQQHQDHAFVEPRTQSQMPTSPEFSHGPSLAQNAQASDMYSQSIPAPTPVYAYHSQLSGDQPNSPASPHGSSIPNPNRPPQNQQDAADTRPQQSPLSHVFPASLDMSGAFQQHPMLGSVGGAYGLHNLPAAAYQGPSLSFGSEIMRVPSASPSVASEGRGSPPLENFSAADGLGRPSTRSSSVSHHRSHGSAYDYSGSGPISPLSSSYGPSALPSSLASMTGGYLHTAISSQQPHASADSTAPTGPDLFLPSSTSAASSSSGTNNRGSGRNAQKTKTKLTDMDRKFICVYAQNHPKARQEDIATKFNVERSTVSKILKSKEKWMKVDFFSSEARTVKHRPSKFPEIEATLINHIRVRVASREPVNDSFIKKMALELAQERGIGKDKFKASSGWVENFKHRHDIRKGGLWDKTNGHAWAMSASAKYGEGSGPSNINGLESFDPGHSHERDMGNEGEGDYVGGGYSMVDGDDDAEESSMMDEEPGAMSSEEKRPVRLTRPGVYASRHHTSAQRKEDTTSSTSSISQPLDSDPSLAPLLSNNEGWSTPTGQSPRPWMATHQPRLSTEMLGAFSVPHNLARHGTISPPSTASTALTLSRSASTASLTSQGTSPLIRMGCGSPASISSSPAEFVSQKQLSQHNTPIALSLNHGLSFAHRRSFSASYTSSPLSSSDVWLDIRGQSPVGETASRSKETEATSFNLISNSGHGPLASGAAIRAISSRRSVTFSSFSALANAKVDDLQIPSQHPSQFVAPQNTMALHAEQPDIRRCDNVGSNENTQPLPSTGSHSQYTALDLSGSSFAQRLPSGPRLSRGTLPHGHQRAHSMYDSVDLSSAGWSHLPEPFN